MDFENTAPEGVETVTEQEVVEPAIDETGSTEQEVAEPASESERQNSETNAAFQRMRHEKEEMQSQLESVRAELAELQAQNEARDSVYSKLSGSDGDLTAWIAEATGMSEEEIEAEMEAAQESARKDLRIAQLEEQVTTIQSERLMQADLEALRKIDPSLKSLDDLGEGYAEYIEAGLSPQRAYWAVKAEERAKMSTPPKEVGRVATGGAERDYFTDAEIEAMSPEQLAKNYKKIIASWDRTSRR